MSNVEIITITISAAALLISAFLALNTFKLFKRGEVQDNENRKKDLYESIRNYHEYTVKKTEANGNGKVNLQEAIEVIKKSYLVGYEKPNPKVLVPAHKLIDDMYSQFLFDVQTADGIKMNATTSGYSYEIDIKSRSIKDSTPINEFLDQTRDALATIRDIAFFASKDGKIDWPKRRDLLWILNLEKRNGGTSKQVGKEIATYLDDAYAFIANMARNFSNAVTNAKNSKAFNEKDNDDTNRIKAHKELLKDRKALENTIASIVSSEDIKWHPNAITKQIARIARTYDDQQIKAFNELSKDKKVKEVEAVLKLARKGSNAKVK